MSTQYQNPIEGGWTDLKSKVKETWNTISDDTLRDFEGSAQDLVGLIQQQTGEAQEAIAQRLSEMDNRLRPMLSQAVSVARHYVDQTRDTAREAAQRVRQRVATGHEEAQQMVRRRPMESVTVAFGTGLIAGILLGMVLRSR